jgi:hypothetical protein
MKGSDLRDLRKPDGGLQCVEHRVAKLMARNIRAVRGVYHFPVLRILIEGEPVPSIVEGIELHSRVQRDRKLCSRLPGSIVRQDWRPEIARPDQGGARGPIAKFRRPRLVLRRRRLIVADDV